MELHVEPGHCGAVLVFLSMVLLIAEDRLQCAVAEEERVVAHHLVMIDLLERKFLGIGITVAALAFGNARCEVEIT